MKKSLLEQLPQIVAEGKRRAEQILEGLDGRYWVRLWAYRVGAAFLLVGFLLQIAAGYFN